MTQTDTDTFYGLKKTVWTASAIALLLFVSFFIPKGMVHAAACTTAFCAEAEAATANLTVNTPVALTVSLTNTGAPRSNAIVDIEIYDANNTRVHQQFFDQQYLPTTAEQTYTTSFTPKSTGTYQIKTGIFGSEWSHLYYWTDTAGSITVQNQIAPVMSAVSSGTYQASVWWPTNNASINGVQPFKAVLDGKPLGEYEMFWQVGNGLLNAMYDSYSEAPHKQALVDVTNWNWRGSGPYTITFIAKNRSNSVIAKKSIAIYTQGSTAIAPPEPSTIAVQPISQPVEQTSVTQIESVPVAQGPSASNTYAGNPLSGKTLYINPQSPAKKQAEEWRHTRPQDASRMDMLATQPQSQWFGGWNSNIYADVRTAVGNANALGQIPVLVAYNIPLRDCGGWSGGGVGNEAAYTAWIQSFADAIQNDKAVVILEPDAIAHMDCLSETDKQKRFKMMSDAVHIFKSKPNTAVYIDAGHAFWVPSDSMSERLKVSGIDKADGFSLNVSNFISTGDNISYGEKLSKLVNNKHFVIDTSRNGLGPNGGEWCNPSGRAFGQKPTTNANNPLVDALLWIKTPGESDGSCNGGPAAGQWWGEYALGLAVKAGW